MVHDLHVQLDALRVERYAARMEMFVSWFLLHCLLSDSQSDIVDWKLHQEFTNRQTRR